MNGFAKQWCGPDNDSARLEIRTYKPEEKAAIIAETKAAQAAGAAPEPYGKT